MIENGKMNSIKSIIFLNTTPVLFLFYKKKMGNLKTQSGNKHFYALHKLLNSEKTEFL